MTGLYKHYKGDFYIVLDFDVHQSTNDASDEGEPYVLYYSINLKKLNVRRLSQFTEQVTLQDGTKVPRFARQP